MSQKITYTCAREGCDVQRTKYKSHLRQGYNHFCSVECKRKGMKPRANRITFTCSNPECDVVKTDYVSQVRHANKYCSKECVLKARWLNKPKTREARREADRKTVG